METIVKAPNALFKNSDGPVVLNYFGSKVVASFNYSLLPRREDVLHQLITIAQTAIENDDGDAQFADAQLLVNEKVADSD
jgi:hypothetical protein